ncbi:MAG: response regulator receiver protein [Burkholderiales bacterium]|jgi:hypothetical protein|nr:response regulator receiver protein [Burkholderiales bacterium]
MVKKLVATHRYKTTVLFYDDNFEYLDFLKNNLASNRYNFKFVNNLDDFNQYTKLSASVKETLPQLLVRLDNELSDNPKHDSFDFDISRINKLRQVANKSDEISIVFIDNNLKNSEYNGLCICGNIGESSFKKVLLTGECDRIDAINALNSKQIDLYIEKYNLTHKALDNVNIIEKIMAELQKLTDRFFIESNSYVNELISNQDFKELFDEIIKKLGITEYYLQDKETFLMIDSEGREIFLTCWNEDKFNVYIELHSDELDSKKLATLDGVKQRKFIPTYFGVKEALKFKNLYYCIY